MAGACGIPSSATAVSVNLTVVNPTAQGELIAYPADELRPTASAKGGGKTGGKVSKDALKTGRETVDRLRKELKELKSKPNKTPADKAAYDRKAAELNRALDRLRRSEEHARIGQR
jgi:hypothetical protein